MKYIVIRQTTGTITREFPIMFPNELSHVEVANALLKGCPELKEGNVVGAGEMSCMDVEPNCSGRSSTLNINSREELDDQAFSMRDYTMGVTL